MNSNVNESEFSDSSSQQARESTKVLEKLATENQPDWIVEPGPHLSDKATTRRLMIDVIIALLPAMAAAIYVFGFNAIRLTGLCLISCLATEFLFNVIRKRPGTLGDFSAVVTAIILAFSLPPTLPNFAVIIGSVVAIAIGKMVFGGLGQNIFNPAMVGRAFLMTAFPVLMTTWVAPIDWKTSAPMTGATLRATYSGNQKVDAVTQATPLTTLKPWASHDKLPAIKALLIGRRSGSLGETSVVALLLGAAYLLLRKTITWHIPIGMIGAAVIFGGIGHLVSPEKFVNPMFHVGAGAMIFGAFYIATDLVSSPLSRKGQLIYGIGCGVLTMVIRQFGTYPEGVMFSILMMNGLAPLITRYTMSKPLGGAARA
jgi:electron transport complex protein RnfD